MNQIKIGEFLKELRKEKGLTQEQFAEQFNVSRWSVSRWETGYSLPDNSVMLKLCDIFGISVNELLSGERLSSMDYNKKAEENIMTLIQEKHDSKKKDKRQFVLGTAVIALLAVYFVWFINRATVNRLQIKYFMDFIALNVDLVILVLMLIFAGRFHDFLNLFKFNIQKSENTKKVENVKEAATFAIRAILLAGGICSQIYMVNWLRCLDNAKYWGSNLNSIVLGLFYSLVISAVLLVLRERLKK